MASAATAAIAATLCFTKIRPSVFSLQKSDLSIPVSYSAVFSAPTLAIAQFSSGNADFLRRRVDRISCHSNSPTVPVSVSNYEVRVSNFFSHYIHALAGDAEGDKDRNP